MPKAPSKTASAPRRPKKRKDRRGTPKGKGTRIGGTGAKTSGKSAKGKIGNPPFVPTDQQRIQVETYVAAGTQQWLIAEYLQISEDTLTRHFRIELDHGKARIDAKLGSSVAKKALEGDVDMTKFYLARRGGWKTTTAVESSGPDGGPIVYTAEPPRRDLGRFNEQELETYERLTAKLEQPDDPGNQ